MWSGSFNQELCGCHKGGNLIAHYTLVVRMVTFMQVANGQVATYDARTIPWKVVAVTLQKDSHNNTSLFILGLKSKLCQ